MPDMATSLIKGELNSDSTPVEVMLGDINSIHIEVTKASDEAKMFGEFLNALSNFPAVM